LQESKTGTLKGGKSMWELKITQNRKCENDDYVYSNSIKFKSETLDNLTALVDSIKELDDKISFSLTYEPEEE
jgi:hypothetical protein